LKYHFNHSSIYIEGTDVPKNKKNIKDTKFIHTLEKNMKSKLVEESFEPYWFVLGV